MSTCGEEKPYTTEQMTAMTPPAGNADVSYYWSNSAQFRVEGKVYSVPIYPFLMGSEYFVEKYGLSPGDSLFSAEGVIELKGTTIAQFLVFLKFLFPTHQLTSTDSTFTHDEWLTILMLSTLWHFHEARGLAIEHLDGQLSELELIDVGRANSVSRWVLDGYISIVKRPRRSVITKEEANAIGHEAVCQLWTVRYQLVIEELAEASVELDLLSKFETEMRVLKAVEMDHRTKNEVERVEKEAEERRKIDEELRVAEETAEGLRLKEERRLEQEAKKELERLAQEERAAQARMAEEERKREEEIRFERERIEQMRLEEEKLQKELDQLQKEEDGTKMRRQQVLERARVQGEKEGRVCRGGTNFPSRDLSDRKASPFTSSLFGTLFSEPQSKTSDGPFGKNFAGGKKNSSTTSLTKTTPPPLPKRVSTSRTLEQGSGDRDPMVPTSERRTTAQLSHSRSSETA